MVRALLVLALVVCVGCGSTYEASCRWMRRGAFTMLGGGVVVAGGVSTVLTAPPGESGTAQASIGAVIIGLGALLIVPIGSGMYLGGHMGRSGHPRPSAPPP